MSIPSGFWRQETWACPGNFDYLELDAELRIGICEVTFQKGPNQLNRAPMGFRYETPSDGRVLMQPKRSGSWSDDNYHLQGNVLWWKIQAASYYRCWDPITREDLPEWWPRLYAAALRGLLPS